MLKLYRFLNPQGDGVYQNGFCDQIGLVFSGDIPFYQPPLYEDVRGFKFDQLGKYQCAFDSPDQIMSWFRDIDPLNIFVEGGSLLEITVDPKYVLRGRHQCIYQFKQIESKRIVDVDEFIELVDKAETKMRAYW